jgi:hypothetical protein
LIPSDDIQCKYVSGSPNDLAKQLGESGIAKLLELVGDAYARVSDSNSITIAMNEDEITEEIFKEVICGWRESSVSTSLIPINQKIDRELALNEGRLPSIDFCFRDRFIREVFFGFECKILGEGDSNLSREYINNGLCRYLEGKYCSRGSTGSMIGYVRFGKISLVIQEIKRRVDKESAICAMNLATPLRALGEHYTSVHKRQRGLSEIVIHHLFFDFA